MVRVYELSATLVRILLQDFQRYQDRFRETIGSRPVGFNVPRSRTRWLELHYKENMKKGRQETIKKAIEEYNRTRGKPVQATVFKDAKEYVECLSQLEVEDSDNVVYRGASDSVWKSLRRYVCAQKNSPSLTYDSSHFYTENLQKSTCSRSNVQELVSLSEKGKVLELCSSTSMVVITSIQI